MPILFMLSDMAVYCRLDKGYDMRVIYILITILSLTMFNCEQEPLPTYPEVISIGCQEDADEAKLLIGDAIFNENNPEEGFKGDIVITNNTNGCTPISDLSLFENFEFWRGALIIESDQITDLDFIKNIVQVRAGFEIKNCPNLTSINLPKLSAVGEYFVVENNAKLATIAIGKEMDIEVYDEILIDSLILVSNPILSSWEKGLQSIDFIQSATITNNPELRSLAAFSELSMPSRNFNMDMYRTIINPDGENPDTDSLTMPQSITINAMLPNNDYSWLNKAKGRNRFEVVPDTIIQILYDTIMNQVIPRDTLFSPIRDTVKVDSVMLFNLEGEIAIQEVCDFKDIINDETLPLRIFSAIEGEITGDILADQCPE